ncbi:unnamed protein product [Rotaria sp. Silwood1]|nr:unnamed protein product [Rotaria sp. Silwood1]CAF4990680.1 unnamed protein product [Rotaria sp. Silwood1]CAF5170786.1 unnamed protein product [Rotaria sp. Silwood1]
MPLQLRDKSSENMPNFPLDFNLTTSDTTTINTRSNIPVSALSQRPYFATQTITTNDTTQPFNVYDDENVNGQQPKQKKNNQPERRTTTTNITASYRHR